jgi:DNA polymerase kappa
VPDSEAEEELTANDLAYWDEACQKQAACSLFTGENKHTTAACALGGQGAEGTVGASASSEGAAEATVGTSASSDYDTVFTNAKAGMEDVDKTYVKNVVFEMSKDSNFFKNEQRKSEENSRRNLVLKQKLEALSAAELDAGEKWAAQYMLSLERSRDLSRTFIHVDMDMFFAAVEQMHRKELADVPFAIGGIGMISTANYVARKYGVRSAMPGFIGKVLCSKPAPGSNLPPVELVFISPNFEKYSAVSQQVKEILKTFDAFIQSGGIDEAYLDVTDYMRTNNRSGVQVAEEIRARIRAAEYALPGSEAAVSGLTCSCGIAPNRRLAKICSDINKPDGQYVLGATREDILRFVSTLPIRKVGGIGKVSERMLHEVFSVTTCDDLRRMRAPIARLLHRCTAEFLLAVAIGAGSSDSHQQVESAGHGRKGISCERTFRSLFAKKDLEAKALELAEALAADMKEGKLQGKTLTLKVLTLLALLVQKYKY